MRKKILWTIVLLAIMAIPAWRFWPSGLESILPEGTDGIVRMSCHVNSHRVDEFGEPHIDIYNMGEEQMTQEDIRAIIDILTSCKYRRDFRNLIPWGIDGVTVTGNTQSANLFWVYEGEAQEHIMITFMKHDTFLIHFPDARGMQVFHPTDREMQSRLVEYVIKNGVPYE